MKTVTVIEKYFYDTMGDFELIDYEVFNTPDAALCAHPTAILHDAFPSDSERESVMRITLDRDGVCRMLVCKPVTA